MKKIKLPSFVWMALPEGVQSATTPKEVFEDLPGLRMQVLDAAQAIESQLEEMLDWLLFLKMPKEDRHLRTELVLRSSWCTFEAKKKLFLVLISQGGPLTGESGLVTGKDLGELDELLAKVIGYRNAFTHGRLVISGPEGTINYFEGKPMRRPITDEYLENLESRFGRCSKFLEQIASELLKVQ